jgi:hypothetical protein
MLVFVFNGHALHVAQVYSSIAGGGGVRVLCGGVRYAGAAPGGEAEHAGGGEHDGPLIELDDCDAVLDGDGEAAVLGVEGEWGDG